MLTTNLIRKDLQSSNIYDVGVALSGLSCFATSDLSRDLVNDVVNLVNLLRISCNSFVFFSYPQVDPMSARKPFSFCTKFS